MHSCITLSADSFVPWPKLSGSRKALSRLASGTSTRIITRLFQAETGMSSRAWRQKLRLQRALQMLANSRTVTLLALELVYDSPSAFITMFRRTLGASPTRYLPSTEARVRPHQFPIAMRYDKSTIPKSEMCYVRFFPLYQYCSAINIKLKLV